MSWEIGILIALAYLIPAAFISGVLLLVSYAIRHWWLGRMIERDAKILRDELRRQR